MIGSTFLKLLPTAHLHLRRDLSLETSKNTYPVQGLRTEVLTSNRGVWVQLGAVCWQPTGLKDGSLDIKQVCLGPAWSCMLATYRAYGRKSSHQTRVFGSNLELHVGNLQGLRTEVLTSNRGVWVQLGAVCWQPTGLKDGSLDVT